MSNGSGRQVLAAVPQVAPQSAWVLAIFGDLGHPYGRKAECGPAIAFVDQVPLSCKHQKSPLSFVLEVSASVKLSEGPGSEASVAEARNSAAVPLMFSVA